MEYLGKKINKKYLKKVLTREARHDIIVGSPHERELKKGNKNPEKSFKKVLTKASRCGIM